MDSIRSLLDESTLQRIANEAGQGVTEQQVEDVLNAVLPGIEKDTASGRLATRAAEAQQQTVTRGGTRAGGMDLLSMLLGGNASTATQTAASNANVSSGQAGSILKIAAPILLFLLLMVEDGLKNSLADMTCVMTYGFKGIANVFQGAVLEDDAELIGQIDDAT